MEPASALVVRRNHDCENLSREALIPLAVPSMMVTVLWPWQYRVGGGMFNLQKYSPFPFYCKR